MAKSYNEIIPYAMLPIRNPIPVLPVAKMPMAVINISDTPLRHERASYERVRESDEPDLLF